MRLLPTAATTLLFAAAAAAPASAQTCVAPPGTSGVDQYCETVPSDRGDRPSGADRSAPAPLSQAQVRRIGQRLDQAGADGRALGQLTGLRKDGRRRGYGRQSGSDGGAQSSGRAPANDPLGAVGSVISSGTGLSGAFVTILLLIAVVILGGAFMAARARRQWAG